MNYYRVGVSSVKYRGYEPLTYASTDSLPIGSVVMVEMRGTQYPGIVIGKTAKPQYATKPITQRIDALPRQHIALLQWQAEYYPAPLGVHCSLFAPGYLAGPIHTDTSPKEKQTPVQPNTPNLPPLTNEQHNALQKIESLPLPATCIIHGRTGSGKTRLYIEAIQKALRKNRSSLVLSPEIGLSSQLVDTFKASLPSDTELFIIHSGLTPKERRIIWHEISTTTKHKPAVIVGPRSALYSPIHNVGLVVVDEFHDAAYKQDQSPYYHANRVASKLAKFHKALLIFGSATPPVQDIFLARTRNIPIIRLAHKAIQNDTSTRIQTIDMRNKDEFSKNAELSDTLLGAITASMQNKKQTLLLLNRRGTARFVVCTSCDWQALCPRCDLPLVFHADSYNLRCHTCSYTAKTPTSCPQCSNADIVFRSSGTKSIETIVKKIFPSAKVMRFDTDNKKSEQLNNHVQDLINAKVDIIIGTQIIAKGLDLPKLGTVGVLYADSSLSFPDYTANEITNQLITQVIGRADRGHNASEIIIQTLNPTNPAIQSAIRGDWEAFYETELRERKQYNFPPFKHTLKLTVPHSNAKKAAALCKEVADTIKSKFPDCIVSEPTPAFYAKRNGKFFWQIIVRSSQRNELANIARNYLPPKAHYDIDPTNLL